MYPVAIHRTPTLTVTTYGQQEHPLETALLVAKTQGVNLAHMVTPPSGPHGPGFQTVVHAASEMSVLAEGMVVPMGSAVAITSRDCPIVTLEYRDPATATSRGVVFHAGRPALSPPTDCAGCAFSVVAPALNAIAPVAVNRSHVFAYITASICGLCFTHPNKAGRDLLKPFRRVHCDVIIDEVTGALDLVQVIKNDLVGRGVPVANITHDGLCTKQHPDLASKRGGDVANNLVVVCHHPT